MLIYIILIFINSGITNAFDESSENRFIDLLPEKEKRLFLERVARRILEEVKSGEAGADIASGEITDDQLKQHNDYIARVLKEESKNLKRRYVENNEAGTTAKPTTQNIITENSDETEKDIQDIEKAIENIEGLKREKSNNNQAGSSLLANDTQEVTSNPKIETKNKSVHLSSSHKNYEDGQSKLQEVEKAQDVRNNTEQENIHALRNENADNVGKIKVVDLTFRNDEAKLEEVKLPGENDKIMNLALRKAKETVHNSSIEKTMIHGKINGPVDNKIKENPVSIEITFVNDADYKEGKEIPVKVVNNEQQKDVPSIPEKTSSINKAPQTDLADNPPKDVSISKINSKIPDKKKEAKNKFRKSYSDAIDDNVHKIEDKVDNQVARKKRKSGVKSDTNSTEIIAESTRIIVEKSQNDKGQENVNKNDSNTVTQSNINSNVTSDITADAIVQESTTEAASSNGIHNTSSSSSTIMIANATKLPPDASSFMSTTVKEEIQQKLDEFETTTEIEEIQHTQIVDFDTNDNETVPDLVVTENSTGSTTEEIVKMRTKYISGYPEDSYENMTKEEDIKLTTNNATVSSEDNIGNVTENIKDSESHINVSFYAQKLSDKEDNNGNGSLNIQETPEKTPNADENKPNIDLNTKKQSDLTAKTVSIPNKETNNKDSTKQDVESRNEKDKTTDPSNVLNSKNFEVQHNIGTTIASLKTSKINEKSEIFYAIEAPVEIQNDSVVIVEGHDDSKENLPPQKEYISGVDVTTKIFEPLRQGLKPGEDAKDYSYNTDILVKIQPPKKEYVVWQLLPGEQPFVKQELAKKRSKKLNPNSYPKTSHYLVTKKNKNQDTDTTLPSQIEQPNYAPVYNYAPEYAYYNPKNKYGPNADDDETKLVNEKSDESDVHDLKKIFDYDIINRPNNPQSDIVSRSDRYILTTDRIHKKENTYRVSEDYYFGVNKKEDIREADVSKLLRSRKRKNCHGKRCKDTIVTVEQDEDVPPNSDEPQHAYNAFLNIHPPASHTRQVENILNNLGYFSHHANHQNIYKNSNKSPLFYHGSDQSNWIGPDIDLFLNDKLNKPCNRRLDGDRVGRGSKNSHIKYYTLKIPRRLQEKNKFKLNQKQNLYDYQKQARNLKYKKRPLLLLTGRLEKAVKNDKRKRPLLFLTGTLKDNDEIVYREHKVGNKKGSNKKYYFIDQELSDDKHKFKKKKKNQFSDEFVDDDGEQYKKAKRSGQNEVEYEYYHDPYDISSGEPDTLKELNQDIVKLIINMSEADPSLQHQFFEQFRNLSKLYKPPKKIVKKEYEEFLHKPKHMSLRSSSQLEACVNVMKDMIDTNSDALRNYDWLATTVDIRSALTKLNRLSDALNDNSNEIHQKDLQILKYILYLFSTTKYLFNQYEEEIIEAVSEEKPMNLRFTYAEKDSKEYPKNFRVPVDYVPLQKRNHLVRRFEERPWLNRDGIKEKVTEFSKFVTELENVLNDLHDAIKHISLITKYRSQRWYENLKELYLTPLSRKQILEVILHLEAARLFSLIEESASNGLDTNYVRYGTENPKQVDITKEEFATIVELYLELKKLQ